MCALTLTLRRMAVGYTALVVSVAVAATHHRSIHHNDHGHECVVSQLADVEFVLADGSIIYAHRLVLAHVSEYFQQLFLGGYLPSSPATPESSRTSV